MKNDSRNELAVCGFEAVKALVKCNPQKITRFYYTRDRMMDFKDLFKSLAERKVPYNNIPDGELEKLSGTVHHQGVVAMIKNEEIPHLNTEITDGWLHNKESAILLDRVGNANNLGAIVRSAAFFGIKNIVIPRDEAQSSVTTSSYRVAQGGMEYVNVYSIQSIEKLLLSMKGKMLRFGTDVRATMPVSEIPDLCNEKNKPALIVLGNEEHGISPLVRRNCDELVIIPFSNEGSRDQGRPIESLNVAQAAAIVLYECRRLKK
ncbi:MAG: RNA methyltransferase [Treponema sp.]|nr:RNA methyltransferase [Treponema sp.]